MRRSWALNGFALAACLLAFCSLASTATVNAQAKPRELAEGVLQEILPSPDPRDLFSLPRPLPGLAAPTYQPETIPEKETLAGMSRRVILTRDALYELEFSFIPLRQAELTVALPNLQTARKNHWYLIYRIRNTGKTLKLSQVKQSPEFEHLQFDIQSGAELDGTMKFLPRFTLQGWVLDSKTGEYNAVTYRDEINPIALEQIRVREDANQRLLDTHQMSQVKFPVAKSDADPGVWGVAIWTDIDPRIDFVSVSVKGLTNAFRIGKDVDDLRIKTLQLNFWRPGDIVNEDADQIDYGIPLVDDPQRQVLICKRYNLPGPLIRAYVQNEEAQRDVLVAEIDAQISLTDFESPLTPILDQGKLPTELLESFKKAGFDFGAVGLTTAIEGRKWTFQDGEKSFIISLEPQFWEPNFGKIRFIKSLDHVWLYR